MSELTACQRLDIIRHKGRPTAKDYIPLIFDDFFEMHGDRLFGDDGAVMGGIAYLGKATCYSYRRGKGQRSCRKSEVQFRYAPPGGL